MRDGVARKPLDITQLIHYSVVMRAIEKLAVAGLVLGPAVGCGVESEKEGSTSTAHSGGAVTVPTQTPTTTEALPESISASEPQWFFGSVVEMVATSDLVVRATVLEAGVGRQLGIDEDGSPPAGDLRARYAIMEVERVFKGESPADGRIVLEELGYDGNDNPFMLLDHPWSLVGDEGIFFLYQGESYPQNHFVLVSPDGRVLYDENETLSFANTPLGLRLTGLDPGTFTQLVAEAARTVREQNIPALQPFESVYMEIDRPPHPRETVPPTSDPTSYPPPPSEGPLPEPGTSTHG